MCFCFRNGEVINRSNLVNAGSVETSTCFNCECSFFSSNGQAALAKKGEDYFIIKPDCQRVPGDLSTSFSVFAGRLHGTTVTFVVIDEWTVTVASVGDSRCILDSQGGVVSLLTVDHRLEEKC
ncbi:hypothetical protein NC651_029455 [Populus alba x Populus x berolinensis]|nr:hypothetical protein NC651_029455 [Populus alba x Populus x berolinensis]